MVDRRSATENRGVNVALDNFYDSQATDFPSLHEVRNQLQSVIEVMGNSTPHLVYTNDGSGDTDEESIISTSIISSVLQFKHSNKPTPSPQDISEASNPRETETFDAISDLPHENAPRPLCVPAVLPPAVLCMNPSCMCTHSFGYIQQTPVPYQAKQENNKQAPCKEERKKKQTFSKFMSKLKIPNSNIKYTTSSPMEVYTMNVTQTANDNREVPKRFVFDLIEGVPKPNTNTIGTNTHHQSSNDPHGRCSTKNLPVNPKLHHTGMVFAQKENPGHIYQNFKEKFNLGCTNCQNDTTKVDVYYFDHGNASYYRTTDSPPVILTEILAEKTESYATKFWAELFGTVYIGAAFFTTFILQFLRFTFYGLLRPLTVGVLQIASDYFFKPLLAVLFNALVQPPLIFFYNIATSLRDLCNPLAEGAGYFLKQFAVLCKSIRLFDIKQDKRETGSEKPVVCEKKEEITK